MMYRRRPYAPWPCTATLAMMPLGARRSALSADRLRLRSSSCRTCGRNARDGRRPRQSVCGQSTLTPWTRRARGAVRSCRSSSERDAASGASMHAVTTGHCTQGRIASRAAKAHMQMHAHIYSIGPTRWKDNPTSRAQPTKTTAVLSTRRSRRECTKYYGVATLLHARKPARARRRELFAMTSAHWNMVCSTHSLNAAQRDMQSLYKRWKTYVHHGTAPAAASYTYIHIYIYIMCRVASAQA